MNPGVGVNWKLEAWVWAQSFHHGEGDDVKWADEKVKERDEEALLYNKTPTNKCKRSSSLRYITVIIYLYKNQ
jgi:hypothetical protein